MNIDAFSRFKSEINSYFALVLLNMVFGAMAMAFGMQSAVALLTGVSGMQAGVILKAGIMALSAIIFGLGFCWVLLAARTIKDVAPIRREFRRHKGPVPDDTLTCWMVRTTAGYRGNRRTIQAMVMVCTLGGVCFLILGLLNSLELYSPGLTSGQVTVNTLLLVPAALLTLGVAVVSLGSSWYFSKFSKIWGSRTDEIARSEPMLAETLGRGLK